MCRWQWTQLATRVGVVQGVVSIIPNSVPPPLLLHLSGAHPEFFFGGGADPEAIHIIYVLF
jgi:hypothetical protein